MSLIAEAQNARRRGMSLVELIVAIAIFTAIMSSVMLMFNSVTGTVRRSYRTMDMYERARGALLTLERDVQTTFAAAASGPDLMFYGEPHGFVLVGIDPNGQLGRLTYAAHVDTSRIVNPDDPPANWRGLQVTLPRSVQEWEVLKGQLGGSGSPNAIFLDTVYPSSGGVYELEVEVIYGLLLRYFESDINHVRQFTELDRRLSGYEPGLTMPRPSFIGNTEAGWGAPDRFPWLSTYLWEHVNVASIPWHVRDRFELVERCHYWLQLLHGPGVWPIALGNPMNLWFGDRRDVFWYDPVQHGRLPAPSPRPVIGEHVVAQDFVLNTYLLDPNTGARVILPDGRPVAVVGPDPFVGYDPDMPFESRPHIDPIFRYAVESGVADVKFNTLFNLNHRNEAAAPTGAFRDLINEMEANLTAPNLDGPLSRMIEARQFYDIGSPLQERLPAAFEVTLWTLNAPVVTGAPPDVYRFSQKVSIPTGFLRRRNTDS